MPLQSKIVMLATASTLLILPAGAIGADPTPAPFTINDTTMEGWAEKRFGSVLGDCAADFSGGVKLRKKKNGDRLDGDVRTVSAVPKDVRDALALNAAAPATLLFRLDQKVSGMFGYVFSSAAEKSSPSFNPAHYLDIDYSGDKDQLVSPKTDGGLYENSCKSILKSALETNASYGIPIASVNAYLKASSDAERRSRVALAKGKFESPIVKMWSGTGLPAGVSKAGSQFFTSLLFWDYYRNHGVATDRYLLHFADGASFYRFVETGTATSVGAGAGAGLGLPFLTVKADVSGSFDQSASVKIQDVDFVVKNTPNGHDFYDLPDLTRILSVGRAYGGARALPMASDQLRASVATQFSQAVEYLPTAYCDKDSWKAVAAVALDANASLQIVHAEPIALDNGVKACRFDLSYDPGGNVANGTVRLPFKFETNAAVLPHNVTQFSFNAAPAIFRGSSVPTLSPRPGNSTEPGQLPGQTRLTWTQRYLLRDNGLVVRAEDVGPQLLELDCGAQPPVYVEFASAFEGNPSPTSQTKTVVLTITKDHAGALPGSADLISCQIVGTLKMIANGLPVDSIFPVGQFIKVPKPTS